MRHAAGYRHTSEAALWHSSHSKRCCAIQMALPNLMARGPTRSAIHVVGQEQLGAGWMGSAKASPHVEKPATRTLSRPVQILTLSHPPMTHSMAQQKRCCAIRVSRATHAAGRAAAHALRRCQTPPDGPAAVRRAAHRFTPATSGCATTIRTLVGCQVVRAAAGGPCMLGACGARQSGSPSSRALPRVRVFLACTRSTAVARKDLGRTFSTNKSLRQCAPMPRYGTAGLVGRPFPK